LEINVVPDKDLQGLEPEVIRDNYFVRIRGLDHAPKGNTYTLTVTYKGFDQPSLIVTKDRLGKVFSEGTLLPAGEKIGFRIPKSERFKGMKVAFVLRENGGEARMISKAFTVE